MAVETGSVMVVVEVGATMAVEVLDAAAVAMGASLRGGAAVLGRLPSGRLCFLVSGLSSGAFLATRNTVAQVWGRERERSRDRQC